MRLKAIAMTMAAGAAALLIAGCGGGGGSAPSQASLQLGGTAATGAALANATVSVKCASGNGTATTNTTGGYTVTVTDGKLPCIIKVSGTTSSGVAVSLHSVAESGVTAADGSVTATANVTPVTEMIVAQLMADLPADAFANFNPQQVTQTALAAASTAIVNALATAGVDLGSIDPLKDALVPKTDGAAGNAYDVLLDQLALTVPPEALPLVVNQIANAAVTNSTEGLITAIQAVAGGTLESCPTAISGKYRVIDFRGAMQVVDVNFATMKVTSDGTEITMTANPDQRCEVSVADGNGTVVMFGPSGIGALRDNYTTGYIFPVQSLAYADIGGGWHFVESGKDESGTPVNFFGKLDFKADRTATFCEYDLAGGVTETCTADPEVATITDLADGGLQFGAGDFPAKFYGFRTPGGVLTLFGTNNPAGQDGAIMQSHFVAFKGGSVLPLPTLNEVRTSWSLLMRATSTQPLTSGMTRERQTITAVDEANGTYSRVYDSSPSVVDIFKVNSPLTGMIERTNRSYIYALPLPGTGVTIAIQAPNNPVFLYSTTVVRP